MRATDQSQTATPTTRTTADTTPRTSGGPPTLKSDGIATFAITPMTMTGAVTRPILSPLPTRPLMSTTSSDPRGGSSDAGWSPRARAAPVQHRGARRRGHGPDRPPLSLHLDPDRL